MNKLEKTGFALIVIGFLIFLGDFFITNELFLQIARYQNMLYWSGMGLWALGYVQRQQKEKEPEQE